MIAVFKKDTKEKNQKKAEAKKRKAEQQEQQEQEQEPLYDNMADTNEQSRQYSVADLGTTEEQPQPAQLQMHQLAQPVVPHPEAASQVLPPSTLHVSDSPIDTETVQLPVPKPNI